GQFPRSISARGYLHRQDSQRGEARRPPRRTANEVRARHQPQDRQGAGLNDPSITACPSRRDHPVMDRRAFITMVGGSILAAPLAAEAQQIRSVPRLGMMSFTTPGQPEEQRRIEIFKQALRELGYVQGQSIAIEYRHSAGNDELFPRLAAELVDLKVDVILTYGTKATRAAKQATSTIPIVMLTVLDPVSAGLVASLARPGGNVTGSSEASDELSAKRLDLLREAVPKSKHVAI